MTTKLGRVIKPDQKWTIQKRQTISLSMNYHHVKYQSNQIMTSVCTVCKGWDLEENRGEKTYSKTESL